MSMEALYLRLPVPLQNAAVSLEGWRIARRRYGVGYRAAERAVQAQGDLDASALQSFREQRLRAFLAIAARSPFWREQFAAHGVEPGAASPFDELRKLPVLTKDTVKQNVERIINPTIDRSTLLWRHTSGTTGSGLVFPEVRETEWFTWAHWWRYRRWHGLSPTMWCGYFGGRSLVPVQCTKPPFWRVNRPARQLMLSGYHLSRETTPAYIAALREFDVEWVHGYPSMLTLIAQFANEAGLRIDLPRLRVVTTGAENLSAWQREAIRGAFGVNVVQHYGQAEAAANISECERGRLHVDEDFSAVEFIDNPHDADSRRLLGTNWLNPAFPLLRYEIGDLVVPEDSPCACGRPGRTVRNIDGRQEDYLTLPSGVRIGRLDHIFKDMVNVREAQFVQADRNVVTLRIARSAGYTDRDEQVLLDEIRQRIGTGLRVAVEYVDAIPRGPNGKLRLVLSSLPKT